MCDFYVLSLFMSLVRTNGLRKNAVCFIVSWDIENRTSPAVTVQLKNFWEAVGDICSLPLPTLSLPQ